MWTSILEILLKIHYLDMTEQEDDKKKDEAKILKENQTNVNIQIFMLLSDAINEFS
jgi:hypothetical protein